MGSMSSETLRSAEKHPSSLFVSEIRQSVNESLDPNQAEPVSLPYSAHLPLGRGIIITLLSRCFHCGGRGARSHQLRWVAELWASHTGFATSPLGGGSTPWECNFRTIYVKFPNSS